MNFVISSVDLFILSSLQKNSFHLFHQSNNWCNKLSIDVAEIRSPVIDVRIPKKKCFVIFQGSTEWDDYWVEWQCVCAAHSLRPSNRWVMLGKKQKQPTNTRATSSNMRKPIWKSNGSCVDFSNEAKWNCQRQHTERIVTD